MEKIFGNSQPQPALKHIKTPEKSDRQIAKDLGVDNSTISEHRKKMVHKDELLDSNTSIGSDGKSYPRHVERKPVSDKKTDFSEPLKENISSYRQCNLKDFYSVIRLSFGMGIDYAMKDDNGTPLKSWFTIDDVVNALKEKGFLLMAGQARNYLEDFVRQNYFETRENISGTEYRRKTWFVKL